MSETSIASLRNRDAAQQRTDQIGAFQEELSRLQSEGILALSEEQQQRVTHYHRSTLQELATRFDVDTTTTQKQMSLGMRIISLLGALALAASAFFFFYRIWGLISTPAQIVILIASPILGVLGMKYARKREQTPYFTAVLALVAFAAFVLNVHVLGGIYNITPSQNAFLAWAAFALILAYAYELKLLLVAGIVSLLIFLSASMGTWRGVYWLSFGLRPEDFIPAGLLLCLVPAAIPHRRYPDFPGYYRLFGLLTVLLAMLILSHWGKGSYLILSPKNVETVYQLLGFLVAGLTIWAGVHWGWHGVTNLGSTFFVIQLYTKFYDWWWEWMPKYLFFLTVGLVAVLLLLIFQRLRLQTKEAAV